MTWVKGQSGNPGGRRPGRRMKLTGKFLDDVELEWRKHGKKVLEAVRLNNPRDYMNMTAKIVMGLMPKDVDVNQSIVAELKNLGDDALNERIEQLERNRGAIANGGVVSPKERVH